jgi:hypothetical protein
VASGLGRASALLRSLAKLDPDRSPPDAFAVCTLFPVGTVPSTVTEKLTAPLEFDAASTAVIV